MEEVLVKTHLLVTDIQNEYDMNWCGKIKDADPVLKNGKPIFIITSSKGRIELNTIDMKYIEERMRANTEPKGRSAITSDQVRVYILNKDGTTTLMGVMTHKRIKHFAPMFDPVYYN
mgnify:CR=1 FL=1